MIVRVSFLSRVGLVGSIKGGLINLPGIFGLSDYCGIGGYLTLNTLFNADFDLDPFELISNFLEVGLAPVSYL